ncbi:uncharacterized protein [Dermacentor andersoni]|uniref:uncharacterized protein isoform X3 n=1 Tax=Dermacentor andersoni TaxID=34620 RepID=UPI002417FFF0|nr:uncharacterized protein LOC129380471 isoform X3 [Dermacentor andersoni]
MGRVTKFPTSRCPTGTQGEATSLPLMSSLSRTNTTSDLLKRRKKRRSRILTRNRGNSGSKDVDSTTRHAPNGTTCPQVHSIEGRRGA